MTAKKRSQDKKETWYPSYEYVNKVNKAILGDKEALNDLPESTRKRIAEMAETFKPRPIERIPKILEELRKLWLMYPDQRFGQLLENYVFTKGPRNESTIFLFYQEDDETLRALKEKTKGIS